MEASSDSLSDFEQARYAWQLPVSGFGLEGQRKLKNASVLVSRLGGVGGLVAYQLAAAGIGKLILAHAGNVKPSDLNRQLLMTHDWLGKPRIQSAVKRLHDLNPSVEIVGVPENVNKSNVEALVKQCDLIVDCAPLFDERFAMNDQAVLQQKPMVECAMYELEAQLTCFVPGTGPCLRCLIPEAPAGWTRQFPVFGAVSGSVACLAAMEAIKLIAGFGRPLIGQLLQYDLRDMSFAKLPYQRKDNCPCCSPLFNQSFR
ncbi:MAG: HesA/MoeB/ThiF family protein [Planctomycetales bacterium]|nr:HesA/MoeB/ThiF family protein [Planctomycetales bacterium]